MQYKFWLIILLLVSGIYACTKDRTDYFEGFIKPSHFPEPVYDFTSNTITLSGFELGRKLFYETALSRNNTISCGSCHIQTSAFTQHGHSVSHGIEDRLGKRNSPPIMNLAWSTSFMWDGGVFNLDMQPIVPITAHEEMDENLENVINKLNANDVYRKLFKQTFGADEITTATLLKSLSQFMLLCVSHNARYDSVMQQKANFTGIEKKGYALYQAKCGACHREPLFTDYSFRNNGIGNGATDDAGRYAITLNETDRYKFKVPSLRNLGYTAPYMHDGRFITLDAVLDHYSKFIKVTANTDPLLVMQDKPGFEFSGDEKEALLAFLKTLNDPYFLRDKKLSEQ